MTLSLAAMTERISFRSSGITSGQCPIRSYILQGVSGELGSDSWIARGLDLHVRGCHCRSVDCCHAEVQLDLGDLLVSFDVEAIGFINHALEQVFRHLLSLLGSLPPLPKDWHKELVSRPSVLLNIPEFRDEVPHNRTKEEGPTLQACRCCEKIQGEPNACMEIFRAAAKLGADEDLARDNGNDAEKLLTNGDFYPLRAWAQFLRYCARHFRGQHLVDLGKIVR